MIGQFIFKRALIGYLSDESRQRSLVFLEQKFINCRNYLERTKPTFFSQY
jgi:hypothetical protein